jgi:hypothetical protein
MAKKRISTSITQNNILQALEKNLGVITPALKMAGVGRSTYYKMLETDPEFKAKINELKEIALDYAETSLFKQIKNGTPSSTMFYLKTKGKHRGYIEQQDVTSGGEKINSQITVEVVRGRDNE